MAGEKQQTGILHWPQKSLGMVGGYGPGGHFGGSPGHGCGWSNKALTTVRQADCINLRDTVGKWTDNAETEDWRWKQCCWKCWAYRVVKSSFLPKGCWCLEDIYVSRQTYPKLMINIIPPFLGEKTDATWGCGHCFGIKKQGRHLNPALPYSKVFVLICFLCGLQRDTAKTWSLRLWFQFPTLSLTSFSSVILVSLMGNSTS